MLSYYGDRISPHMTDSPEGYLICHDVPIARTGKQEYLARELMLDGDPERIVEVTRLPEDVFETATIASFEGKPVTDNHPPEDVGPENYAAYLKGHVQNVRKAGDYIVADLYINDSVLASEVKNGIKREVSCGYLCNYEPDGNGYRQTKIRGNHVAVVPKGRAGHEVAIKDHAAERAEKGKEKMKEFTKSLLALFGRAAKDASPEELTEMTDATMKALEAAPAEKAQEADPAKDEMVEKAPKGDDIGSKLDRILEMLEAKSRGGRGEHPLHDEGDLDEMIEKLSGEKEKMEGKEDSEAAVTVPAESMEDKGICPASKDAAIELLKRIRPAIAQMKDAGEKARVTDALLSAVRGDTMDKIVKATTDSARNPQKHTYESICTESENNYAARNPHKKED